AGAGIAGGVHLALVPARAGEKRAIVAATEGGMEMEEVAAKSPEKILTVAVEPASVLPAYAVRRIGFGLGMSPEQVKHLEPLLGGLFRLFVEKDASLAEINPLVVTKEGRLLALDAKLNFDDNALYRHADVAKLRDP